MNFGAFSRMKEPRTGKMTTDGRDIHRLRSGRGSREAPSFRGKAQPAAENRTFCAEDGMSAAENGQPGAEIKKKIRKPCGSLKAEVYTAFNDRDFRMAFLTNLLWLTAFYTA